MIISPVVAYSYFVYLCGGKKTESSAIKSAANRYRYGMMVTMTEIPDGEYNSLAVSAERNGSVHPEVENSNTGKSVGYALQLGVRYWFPIRATYHRAQKVYDALVALHDDRLEPYLPTLRRVECTEGFGDPVVMEEPLDRSLLFMRSTLGDFRALLKSPLPIPGMTPYYDHFHTNEFGRNEYLVVPDRQMESFKIIVESRNQHIIVSQTEVPKFVEGDQVVVTDGPFAGVEGVVMKYKHQKRVFVQLRGVGTYATAYVPGAWLKPVDLKL